MNYLYDIIFKIKNIGEEIENLLDAKLFDLEVRVADMEYGNKNIDVDKSKFKLIYDKKHAFS